MLQLHTFGSCVLRQDGARVDALSGQRRAYALLAVVAAAGERGVSRDTLMGHLWPESDDEHARTSLKQLVRSLRSRLHAPDVLLGSSELRLNPELVTADVAEFRAALARRDQEAAAALYAGPFLDGFFLRGADPFERWVAAERAALARDHARLLEALAERASANGDARAALDCWRRLAAADPLNARAVVGLMRALDVVGERAVALQHARVYEQFVREELDAAPEPAVTALVERLRHAESRARTNEVGTSSTQAGPATAPAEPAARVEPLAPDDGVSSAAVADSRTLARAVALYVAAFTAIALLGQVAVVVFGLPDWVFPGALIIAASGLPVILVTAFVQHPPNAARETAGTAGDVPARGAGAVRGSARAAFAARARRHLTWRRAVWGGVLAIGAFAMFVSGFMISRGLGIGPAASMLAAGTLERSDALLVADFDIRGGLDSSLGSALAEAVRTDLGQSRVVTIVPAGTIREALERMQRPTSAPMVRGVARELAQREGIKAVVEGELTPLRDDFVVTVRLVSPEGDELVSFRETTGQADLIHAIGRLTRRLRGKIGESLKSVRASPPLPQVTTPSLAALRRYSEGARAAVYENDPVRGVARLKEAVALDSTFAMAWLQLSAVYGSGRISPGLANHAAERAYRHRDRLPDRERYAAVGNYFRTGPGRDRMRAAEAFEAGLRLDSGRFATPLALLFMSRREYAHAETLFRWHLDRSARPHLLMYYNLSDALSRQGKSEEADSLEGEAQRRFPGTYDRWRAAGSLYSRGELDSAQHVLELTIAQGDATQRMWGSFILSSLHRLRGRLVEAERARRAMGKANELRGIDLDPFGDALRTAFVDIWHRDRPEEGLRKLEAALDRTPLASLPILSSAQDHFYMFGETYYVWVARTFALAHRPDRARAVLGQFEADVRDTSLWRASAPAIRSVLGEIALAEGKPLVALEEFRRADQLPDGPVHRCAICRDADMGRAFDEAGMADSAIATFERYLETPGGGLGVDSKYAPRILYRLGALYAAKGDRTKAIKYYGRFVELWQNADPELQPVVADVRTRIEALRAGRGD